MGELASSPPPTAVKRLQQGAVVSARPRLDADTDGSAGSYALRRSRRGGRSRRDKKQGAAAAPKPKPQQPEKKTILKRLSPTDLASLTMFAPCWEEDYDYEARLLRELQREWYLVNTAAPPVDPPPYFPPLVEAPPLLWSPARCRECEAAQAAMREPAFHRCVRDAVTVGFRSPVGPIERPAARKPSPSPSPSPPPAPSPGRVPAFLGMSVY